MLCHRAGRHRAGGSDEGPGSQEGMKERLQKTGGQTPAFLCSSTRASFCSSRSSVSNICGRVESHALSPGGEACALECAVLLGRRVAGDGRCAKRVHLREGKSQVMGFASADGGDVSSDGAQTLGRSCHGCGEVQDLSRPTFILSSTAPSEDAEATTCLRGGSPGHSLVLFPRLNRPCGED